jgi:hypothetical protein
MMFTYTETETAENRRDKLAEYVFRLHIADWEGTPEGLAEYCYRYADAMIAEGEVEEAPEEPKVRFNLDSKVRVKLTDYGRAILAKDLVEAPIEEQYIPPEEDADGWSTFRLLSLFICFGLDVSKYGPRPFEDIEVIE